MGEFEFVCPTRIIVTHHLSKALASVKEYLGINRVMIMTDPGYGKIESVPGFENGIGGSGTSLCGVYRSGAESNQ